MKSVLEELYNGTIYPFENIRPTGAEYKKAVKNLTAELGRWKNRLSPEEVAGLENLQNLFSELAQQEMYHAFAHGFKLGAMLLTEAFSGRDELARA